MTELFTIQEAARFLRLHPSTVYRAVERGKIRCYKIGAAIRFDEPQLRDFLAAREMLPIARGQSLGLISA